MNAVLDEYFTSERDRGMFKANCKFNNKVLNVHLKHPGVLRVKMKILEEINGKSTKDYINTIIKSIINKSKVMEMTKPYRDFLKDGIN